jgi:hypothetical protein
MKPGFLVLLACIALFALEAGHAQANDTATERSRIADERIRAEAERRAREEEERQRHAEAQARKQAEAATLVAPQTRPQSASPPRPAPDPAPAARVLPANSEAAGAQMSRVLEQLRTLGELRDAGYVTEQEFDRIKERILDGAL